MSEQKRQELTNAILSELKINKIPIQDMRGQGMIMAQI